MTQPSSAPVAHRSLDFFYDLSCAYSYLAQSRMSALLSRCPSPVTLRFIPVVLGRLQAAHGAVGPIPMRAARLNYLQADLLRWSRRLKLPLHFPSRYPINTLLALRLCVQVAQQSEATHQQLVQRLLYGYFVEDADLMDERVLKKLLQSLDLPADSLIKGCKNPEVAEALRQNTEAAIAHGVFGTPSFLYQGELYWGNDRLDFLEEALLAP